jgi:hypothetical protein
MLAAQHYQLAEHYRRRWLEAENLLRDAPLADPLTARVGRERIFAMWRKYRTHARAANPQDTHPDGENAIGAVLLYESMVAKADAVTLFGSGKMFLSKLPGDGMVNLFTRGQYAWQAETVDAAIARGEFVLVGEHVFLGETITRYERPGTGQAESAMHTPVLATV